MKLKDFLLLLKIPVLLIGIMIMIFSFMSYFIGFQLVLIKDLGLVTLVIHDLFYHLDYTHDYTFATWFVSFMILLVSAGFFLIGNSSREKSKISSSQQGIIKLFSVMLFYLSADEILGFKYYLGKKLEYTIGFLDNTNIEHLGYSWILIYIPLALIFFVFFVFVFNKLAKSIRNVKERSEATKYYHLVILLVPIYLILAVLESYLQFSGQTFNFLIYMEEFSKIIVVYCMFSLLLKIVDNYNL